MYRTVNKNQLACKQKKSTSWTKTKSRTNSNRQNCHRSWLPSRKVWHICEHSVPRIVEVISGLEGKKKKKKFIYAAPCMCSVYGIVWIRLHKQFQSPRLPAGNTYLSLISGDSSSTFVLFPKKAEVRHYAKTSSSCREGDCRNTADTIHYAERK